MAPTIETLNLLCANFAIPYKISMFATSKAPMNVAQIAESVAPTSVTLSLLTSAGVGHLVWFEFD